MSTLSSMNITEVHQGSNSEYFSSDDSFTANKEDQKTIEAVDITNKFFDACRSALEPGELLHEKWFTLQYSMSAIEIMDPKMDARVRNSRHIISISEVLSTKQLPLGPFRTLTDLIGIMDELIAAFVNWLTGDSLAQSVFVCIYMHCTQLIKDKYLRIFCEALRRTIYQLRSLILLSGVFDDEDHCASTHGMPIHEPNKAFDFYADCDIETLHTLPTSELIDSVKSALQNVDNDLELFVDVTENFLSHFRVRLEFMVALLSFTDSVFIRMCPPTSDSVSDIEGYIVTIRDFINEKQLSSEEFVKESDTSSPWESLSDACSIFSLYLSNLIRLCDTLTVTANVGRLAGEGKQNPKDADYGVPGFEVFLNQASLPPYMPQVVIIGDRKSSFTYLSSVFAKIHSIVLIFEAFASWHKLHPHPVRFLSIWAFIQSYGQLSCLFTQTSNYNPEYNKFNEQSVNTCIFARTFIYLLYFKFMYNGDAIHFKPLYFSPTHCEFFVSSWLEFESQQHHQLIKNIISKVPQLTDFFTSMSDQFAQICGIFCLNRSRQRTALESWLRKLPDIISECTRAELVIAVKLAEALSSSRSVDGFNSLSIQLQEKESLVPIRLSLSNYVIYSYYYLSWDYIVSGFQLDLYSSHEWLFIYAFMIRLFQNLGELVKKLSDNYISIQSRPLCDKHSPVIRPDLSPSNHIVNSPLHNNATTKTCQPNSITNRNKRNKKKRKGREKINFINEDIDKIAGEYKNPDSTDSLLFMIHETESNTEMNIITVHHYLTSATLYTIRALQKDSETDIRTDKFSDGISNSSIFFNEVTRLESYAHRLGIFLIPLNSPLAENGGLRGAYDSWKALVASIVVSGQPTSELYQLASKLFDQAYNLIQVTLHSLQIQEKSWKLLFDSDAAISLFTRKFNPPDKLIDLQKLAKHNSIACRVLAVCEDRRPKISRSTKSTSLIPQNYSFLLSSSPVKLDFGFLQSRSYPLIRLISKSGDI